MQRFPTRRGNRAALVLGTVALVTLATLSHSAEEQHQGTMAKHSGDSTVDPEYVRPSARTADTATVVSVPNSVPATTKAVPPLKSK